MLRGAGGDPPRDGYCCGRYASYWNAFLFKMMFVAVLFTVASKTKKNHPVTSREQQNRVYEKSPKSGLLPSATKLRRLCFYTCVSVHRGGLPQCMLGRPPPVDTPRSRHPSPPRSRHTPPEQTPHWEQTPTPPPPPGADPKI